MHDFYKFCGTQITEKDKFSLKILHEGIGKEWIELLEACLVMDPTKRCDYESCLKLSLFDSIRDQNLEESANASV